MSCCSILENSMLPCQICLASELRNCGRLELVFAIRKNMNQRLNKYDQQTFSVIGSHSIPVANKLAKSVLDVYIWTFL